MNNEWDKSYDDYVQKSITQKLIAFTMTQSESSVDKFITSILDIFGMKPFEKTKTYFGQADMLDLSLSKCGLVNGVIENKRGGPFAPDKVHTYRTQLAANMVGIALQNAKISETYRKELEIQHIIGVLHYGLSPVFYKVSIPKEYLERIQKLFDNTEPHPTKVPPLEIAEYYPDEMRHDRLLQFSEPRKQIFKCYAAFKQLLKVYVDKNDATYLKSKKIQ